MTEQEYTKLMVDQAIETLAYTIDAKDQYTRGHSFRVAKYSRMIAHLLGKSEAECREIYLAGLLHDIGKIAISDSIINKTSKLTDDEFEQMKKHPINGAKILEKMKTLPFLQNGALYHHERYDGKGYPFGLQGELIPELARIIAVADAYDTMTSNRHYRSAMEQAYAKQEIWKGIGTQFDPKFAKSMISLIDADTAYDMREKAENQDAFLDEEKDAEVLWGNQKGDGEKEKTTSDESAGTYGHFVCSSDAWTTPIKDIMIGKSECEIRFASRMRAEKTYVWNVPVVIVYTSTDGKMLGPGYEELGVYNSGGYNWKSGPTLSEEVVFKKTDRFDSWDKWMMKNREGLEFDLRASRSRENVFLQINNELMEMHATLNLPKDLEKKIYLSVVGEDCEIYDIVAR